MCRGHFIPERFVRTLKGRSAEAFTLPELLITLVVIAILISLVMPVVYMSRRRAYAAKCMYNLKVIGNAMQIYIGDNSCLFPLANYSRWKDPITPSLPINPNNSNAYWGVAYSTYAGARKELFNCPAALDTVPDGADGTFASGNIYNCYGLNAWAGEWSGFTDTKRAYYFNAGECALFRRTVSGNWVGRSLNYIRCPQSLVVAQDHFEPVFDANGDIFANWYQWAPPAYPYDERYELLRHNNCANALFADWHVEPLSYNQQCDVRYYVGKWPE